MPGGLNDLPEPRSTIERVLATHMTDDWKRRVPKPGLLASSMLMPAKVAVQLFVE